MTRVLVAGSFDDLGLRHVRLLEEAAGMGEVHVRLWTDEAVCRIHGQRPKFPQAERLYLVQAVRYVAGAELAADGCHPPAMPGGGTPDVCITDGSEDSAALRDFCRASGIGYRLIDDGLLSRVPAPPPLPSPAPGRRKVLVTGCYDWLHSGHVRFFEECASYGDLYVVVGHDANIRLLKGEGHPLFPQEQRRYLAGSIRHVRAALISTGHGWLDAAPEIEQLRPDIYAVNEDGDKPEKREFCRQRGLEYLVLKRDPAPGLTRRSSTDLRGF